MNQTMTLLLGILIPLFGTTLGAAAVFFCKRAPGASLNKVLVGFAAGVMIAASVWSLLLPAIDMAEENGTPGWIPAVIGFAVGVGFLLALDALFPLLRAGEQEPCDEHKNSLLFFAVTLHNLPEGMAVGVILAGFAADSTAVTAAGALALSVGIAIQNIPEGAIISMPLFAKGKSRSGAFFRGFVSGVVEPIGAVLTLLLASLITPALPYILSFAAGAMIYVSVEELIPEAQAGSHDGKDAALGTVSIALGFMLMMLLDVLLG